MKCMSTGFDVGLAARSCFWHSSSTADHSCWLIIRIVGRSGRFSINWMWLLTYMWHGSLGSPLTSTARLPQGFPSKIKSSSKFVQFEVVAKVIFKSDKTTISFIVVLDCGTVYALRSLSPPNQTAVLDLRFWVLDNDWWNFDIWLGLKTVGLNLKMSGDVNRWILEKEPAYRLNL